MVNARVRRRRTTSLFALSALTALGPISCQPNRPAVIAYVDPPAIYCYHTLAEADCYAQPIPGEYNRMISYYGPPPPDQPSQQMPGVTITRTEPGM